MKASHYILKKYQISILQIITKLILKNYYLSFINGYESV